MIAVPATSSAGVLPQTQADAALVANENIENPGFIDLLTLLAAALQPQPAPSDGAVSDSDDAAAPLAPDRDRPAEHGDEAATDLTLIVALTAQVQPTDILHDATPQLKASSDLDAARAIIPAQTVEAPPATGADDAKAAAESKLMNPADFTVAGSDHEPIPLEPFDTAKPNISLRESTEVHANSSATADAPTMAMKSLSPADGQHRTSTTAQQTSTSSAPDKEAATLEAPTRQSTVASQTKFSFADGETESFGERGKFSSREAVVELADSTQPRLVHIQLEAGVTRSQPQEKITGENFTAPWRPVVERVAQEIKTRIQFGAHEAVIQLEPPELGKIKIDLRLDGANIHARIVADEPATQALIDNHWAELRQALDTRPVDFANVQFEPQAASGGAGQWSQGFNDTPAQGQPPGAGANGASATQVEAAARADAEAVGPGPGRISMWA